MQTHFHALPPRWALTLQSRPAGALSVASARFKLTAVLPERGPQRQATTVSLAINAFSAVALPQTKFQGKV